MRSNIGKVDFAIVKSRKAKDYEDGNNVFSVASLVMAERMLRERMLARDKDPETFYNSFRRSAKNIGAMGSNISDDQFMIKY
jgi:hypothetical protein